jgi:hypothetical protein
MPYATIEPDYYNVSASDYRYSEVVVLTVVLPLYLIVCYPRAITAWLCPSDCY